MCVPVSADADESNGSRTLLSLSASDRVWRNRKTVVDSDTSAISSLNLKWKGNNGLAEEKKQPRVFPRVPDDDVRSGPVA